MLILAPHEINDNKQKRLDYATDSILRYLDPEMREDIINNEEFKGNRFKSDAYSFGLILLQCLLLKDMNFLQNLTSSM